jgi:hypothetical protein
MAKIDTHPSIVIARRDVILNVSYYSHPRRYDVPPSLSKRSYVFKKGRPYKADFAKNYRGFFIAYILDENNHKYVTYDENKFYKNFTVFLK